MSYVWFLDREGYGKIFFKPFKTNVINAAGVE